MSNSEDKPGMNELMDNSTFEQALIRTGDDEIDDISCLTDRFCALRSLYLETSSINDLDRVIAVVKHIVDSPIDDISRAVWLDDLGQALFKRSNQTESVGDLDEAITSFDNALNCVLITTDDRADYLEHLGNAISERFRQKRK